MRLTLGLGAAVVALALSARAQPAPPPVVPVEPAKAEAGKPEAKPDAARATDLADVPRVRQLCLATRPPERVPFEGDAVTKGNARAEFERTRDASLKALYVAHVPSTGFRLGEWRARDSRLALDLSRPLRAIHGALSLAIPSDANLAFEVTEDQAKAVAAAVRAGSAALEVWFEVRDDQGAVCSGSAASEVYTLTAAPAVVELRDGLGKVLARDETNLADRHRAVVGGYSGTPAVVVGAVTIEGNGDAGAVAKRLQAGVSTPILKCYQKRLETEPSAGGTVVLGIEAGNDGVVSSVSSIANALGDDVLLKCVEDAVRLVKFSGSQLFRVPIELKLSPR